VLGDVLAAAEALGDRPGYHVAMSGIASLSETGALVGEPARTAMLVTLMDGRALTAGEFARISGVTPATASGHLARLVDGGLLAVAAQGRHRYFRLASPAVARMIESMMGVAGVMDAARRCRPVRSGPAEQAMRRARQCYDHLAGEVAVQLADFLVEAGYVEWSADAALVTPEGAGFLERLGVDVDGVGKQRALCRPCMDWSERRPHVAGAVGRSLFQLFLDRDWVRRVPASRAVTITAYGVDAFARHFEIR
jgi:DNA-binding transcriptional ArsR family regulator